MRVAPQNGDYCIKFVIFVIYCIKWVNESYFFGDACSLISFKIIPMMSVACLALVMACKKFQKSSNISL